MMVFSELLGLNNQLVEVAWAASLGLLIFPLLPFLLSLDCPHIALGFCLSNKLLL